MDSQLYPNDCANYMHGCIINQGPKIVNPQNWDFSVACKTRYSNHRTCAFSCPCYHSTWASLPLIILFSEMLKFSSKHLMNSAQNVGPNGNYIILYISPSQAEAINCIPFWTDKKRITLVSTLSSPKSLIGRHKDLPNSFLGTYAPAFYMLYNLSQQITKPNPPFILSKQLDEAAFHSVLSAIPPLYEMPFSEPSTCPTTYFIFLQKRILVSYEPLCFCRCSRW
jgi:hypothetical protein